MKRLATFALGLLLPSLPCLTYGAYTVGGFDTDGDGNGEVREGSVVEFEMLTSAKTAPPAGYTEWPDSGFAGISSETGEWWSATNSQTPWDTYLPDFSGQQPSFHITEDLQAGEAFMVGLSFQLEMNTFTSQFRMTNDLFPVGTDFYFGLQNTQNGNDVLRKDGSGNILGPGEAGHMISAVQGLQFTGSSVGYANSTQTPFADGFGAAAGYSTTDARYLWTQRDAEGYEWVHYTDNVAPGSAKKDSDDIIWEIKDSTYKPGDDPPADSLKVSEWVLFVVLPDDLSLAGRSWVETAAALGATDPYEENLNDSDLANDVVFSWTVDAKAGYSLDENGEIIQNDNYWTPFPGTTVPEPTGVVLLGIAGLLAANRRRRKG